MAFSNTFQVIPNLNITNIPHCRYIFSWIRQKCTHFCWCFLKQTFKLGSGLRQAMVNIWWERVHHTHRVCFSGGFLDGFPWKWDAIWVASCLLPETVGIGATVGIKIGAMEVIVSWWLALRTIDTLTHNCCYKHKIWTLESICNDFLHYKGLRICRPHQPI